MRDQAVINGYLSGKWQVRGDWTGCGSNDLNSATQSRKYCVELRSPGNPDQTWRDVCYNTFYGFDDNRLINNVVRTNAYTSVHPYSTMFAIQVIPLGATLFLSPFTDDAVNYAKGNYGNIADLGFTAATAPIHHPFFTTQGLN